MSSPDALPALPGAEPFSAVGGPTGVLVLHGFTGCPQSMRPLAQALASAGHTVELPLLPGHGTTVEDMATTRFADWSGAADAAYRDLAARCDRVVVAGLSMGGGLAAWLAAEHPEIAGIVAINPLVARPEPAADIAALLEGMLAEGVELAPGVGNDIAKEGGVELAYELAPLRALLDLFAALDELQPRLADVRCPVLLCTSPDDHVVPAATHEVLAAQVGGPVERLVLDRSFHVATLDHDAERIEQAAVAFVARVAGG